MTNRGKGRRQEACRGWRETKVLCPSQAFWLEASSSLGWQRVWEFFSTAETLREVQRVGLRHYRKKVLEAPPPPTPQHWGQPLEPGAVGEAVGHDDVLVEVVGACGAVIFHLINHLADREDGGGGGGGVGLHLWGARGRGDALRAGLVGVRFICVQGGEEHTNMDYDMKMCENLSPDLHGTLLWVLFQV